MLWISCEDCDNAWSVASKYLGVGDGKDIFWRSVKRLKQNLMGIRNRLRTKAAQHGKCIKEDISAVTQDLIEVVTASNEQMVDFARDILKCAVDFIGIENLPCDFSAIGIGSLGRGEATPYSDLEYLFLIENLAHHKFFEKLAVLTYLFIGALGETKLSSMAIDELNGSLKHGVEVGWYIDGRAHGYQIDGITSSSNNVPTRASSETENGGFISTPEGLLAENKAVLDRPDPVKALRGDMTSMLMFTRLLYAVQKGRDDDQMEMEEQLLSKIEEGMRALKMQKNMERQYINMEMLS